MTLQRDTLKAFTDAAADAVARAIAGVQREAVRERELRDAEYRARLAALDTRILAVADLERRVTERLASLKDGKDGRDGVDGKDGQAGERGLDGKDGLNGVDGKDGRDGKDGADGAPGERGLDGKDGRDGADGAAGRDGLDGTAGADGAPGERGIDGKDGRDGVDGAAGGDGLDGSAGERGPEGAPGKLPTVRAWEDRVYYEGEAATFGGATYQASRDTGRSPPHEDWNCIASAGRDGLDGRSFEIRGTYKADEDYRALNVVALNGAAFVAKRDEPGPCPGEGWQLIASQGKQGKPGERGGIGPKGDNGPSGSPVMRAEVDSDGLLRLVNGDGSVVDVDLYPLLSRLG